MVLSYFGDGGFRLQSGDLSLLIDPPNSRLKGDAILKTLVANETVAFSPGEICFPGEYEVRGIEIWGFPIPDESTDKYTKTAYLVRWDDMSFGFLGHARNIPGMEILEGLNDPDILFLPVGGGHFMTPEDAAKVVKKVEPHWVIPSFFKNVGEFLKVIGQKSGEEEKLVFKKKDLVGNTGKVIVLKAQ